MGQIDLRQNIGQSPRHIQLKRFMTAIDRIRIRGVPGVKQVLRHVVLRGQPQHQRLECRVKARVGQGGAQPVEKGRLGRCALHDHRGQHVTGEGPPGLPFVERVRVMCQKKGAFGGGLIALQNDWRRKIPQY